MYGSHIESRYRFLKVSTADIMLRVDLTH